MNGAQRLNVWNHWNYWNGLKHYLNDWNVWNGHQYYLIGSGAWRVVDVVPMQEDLEVLVVHPVAARVWYVQKQTRIRRPVAGAGRLLAELP